MTPPSARCGGLPAIPPPPLDSDGIADTRGAYQGPA